MDGKSGLLSTRPIWKGNKASIFFLNTAICTWDLADSYYCLILSLVTELPTITYKIVSASESQQVQWTKATEKHYHGGRSTNLGVRRSWVHPSPLASDWSRAGHLASKAFVLFLLFIWRCYLLCLFQRIMILKCDHSGKNGLILISDLPNKTGW